MNMGAQGSPEPGRQSARVGFDTVGDVQPGVPAKMEFNIVGAVSGKPVNPIVAHEAVMHLIIVRRDLGYFAHIHPKSIGQVGWYEVTHTFPEAGDYILYDEFQLAGSEDEVHSIALQVGSGGTAPAQLTADLSPQHIDNYTARIAPQGEVVAGQTSNFTVNIEQDGKPVTDLEPYLGAASHVVVLNESARGFAHVHAVAGDMPPGEHMDDMGDLGGMAEPPAKFGPTLSFSHNFEKPGLYKIWSQFSHDGNVQTISWVVEVR